jgi:DNA topoisomerase-1
LAPANVVIVESPAKAKTINKYLGPDYTVIASYGHIRDLPPKDGSVRPDEDFAMDWEMSERSSRPLDAITRAVKTAQHVFLATDPDREGEAISWHIEQVLRQKKLVGKVDIQRVTFNEITKSAVIEAFKHARQVNQELVDAYMARRALDYLVGFNLSPVLWRKLPGSRSAGRVQSVALRLICERENEIERFIAREFWTISAELLTSRSVKVLARLTELDGKKLEKFSLADEASAKAAAARIEKAVFAVKTVEKKQVRRHPAPPFITSTLQQEASRKLGFSATKTMRTAQSLYEGMDIGGETVGLITYMRTDGITLSGEAIHAARTQIGKQFGDKYLPASPRAYKSTAKNAQEAHEAIRPTDLSRTPQAVSRYLNPDERALYDLIWKRTIACQMESAVFDQVTVDFASATKDIGLRATGSVLVFDGFLTLYNEGRDDTAEGDEESTDRRLPPLAEGETLKTGTVKPDQHFTEPPPRYGEASLVKKLEELGIGRPSTYASIMQVLQDREYVRLEARRFVPADRGRIVTAFLSNFFLKYVEYGFTADLETKLDAISAGEMNWKVLLAEFWQAFSAAIANTKDLKISDVIEALDEDLYTFLFPVRADGGDPRVCPTCGAGKLSLKLGKFGAFIGCSNYPDCAYTRPLAQAGEDGEAPQADPTRVLGNDPATGLPVTAKVGPYGAYLQIGPAPDEKPKRVSLPKGVAIATIDLDTALQWLQLPREVGQDPETGKLISANVGRFGPYLKVGELFASLPKDEDVLTIGLNRAIDLIVEKRESLAKRLICSLGNHPETGEAIETYKGKFGPYLKAGKLMASLPKSADAETMTLEDAVALLAAKGKAPAKKGKGKATKSKSVSKAKRPAKARAKA